MDTTLSIKVPGTVVPYVIYLESKNCIILRAGLSILKRRWYKFSTFLFTVFCTLSIFSAFNMAVWCELLGRPRHCLIRRPCVLVHRARAGPRNFFLRLFRVAAVFNRLIWRVCVMG